MKQIEFKNETKINLLPIILGVITFFVVVGSIFTFRYITDLKTQLNESKSKVLNLSIEIDTKNKEIEKLKGENSLKVQENDRVMAAGRMIVGMLDKMEKMFLAYDELFIQEHNWVVQNVTFGETGVWTMNYYLSEHKKLQKEYTDFLQQINSEVN